LNKTKKLNQTHKNKFRLFIFQRYNHHTQNEHSYYRRKKESQHQTMMMKVFALLSLLSMAFGQDPTICEFAIKMYSNSTNDCFNGWPMKQAEAIAGPILWSWQQKVR
jgi:hypothetical protein